MDLDQALHIERAGDGYVVHYAIADVAAFVTPGDPVDLEAHRRGETLYGADSQGPAAPEGDLRGRRRRCCRTRCGRRCCGRSRWTRPARGPTSTSSGRWCGRPRSCPTTGAQQPIDDGTAGEVLAAAQGDRRAADPAARPCRGGVSLPLPEQEIDIRGRARGRSSSASMLPVELWNAQISLLTGFGAASLMVYARVGLLRTLPPPDPRDVQRLHRTAKALGIEWPAEQLYPDFIRAPRPDRAAPRGDGRRLRAAAARQRVRRLRRRGARRAAALGAGLGVRPRHRAAAPPRATATPARSASRCAPSSRCRDWVLAALPGCRRRCSAPARRASATSAPCSTWSRPALLAHRVGEEFDAAWWSASTRRTRRAAW